MTDEGPPKEIPSLAEEWREQQEARSDLDSVYTTALQLSEPTAVRDIASRAGVSAESTREYLRWLTKLGLVEQTDTVPDGFVRDDSYSPPSRTRISKKPVDGEHLDGNEYLLLELQSGPKLVRIPDDPIEVLRSAGCEELDLLSTAELREATLQAGREQANEKLYDE